MPSSDRRENNRRAGSDRRGTQRRQVLDRRYGDEPRSKPLAVIGHESPAEHVRNAMQLLVSALETSPSLPTNELTHVVESALARLGLALGGLERRRSAPESRIS